MPTAETHEESFSFGHAADASEADRTIDIEALDTLRFEPDAVTVNVGETVTFKVHNGGQIAHEFGLGTEADQAAHEQEMQQMASSGMAMHDEANGFALMPGETKELTWTFTEAGTVLYGCHEPGHYAGGMKGTITVE
ncbi:MAG: plastocyanin/azurin family copper-binding protein [Dehalococcoidia bacterium]